MRLSYCEVHSAADIEKVFATRGKSVSSPSDNINFTISVRAYGLPKLTVSKPKGKHPLTS